VPSELAYWKLSGGVKQGQITTIDHDISALGQAAFMGLKGLIQFYRNPERPYLAEPWFEYRPSYPRYRHLSRYDEWGEDS
jgi:ATP-dependent helicase/nuclease subunit B